MLILLVDIVIGFAVVFGVLGAAQIIIETRRWGK